MPRLARHLTAALLWIAIALLPVRGLATALMPAMALPAAQAATLAETPTSMPCHGSMADASAADQPAEPAAAPVGDCPTCALCVLCHGSVAQASPPGFELAAMPPVAPAVAPASPIEPRAPDGLFRPPRPLLA